MHLFISRNRRPQSPLVLSVAREVDVDGRAVDFTFSRQAANASLGIPVTYSADARQDQPRPAKVLANCQNLTKQ